MADTWTGARARVAINTRHHGADSPEVVEARRDLAAARIEDYIARTVAAAPPLSDQQRMHLARLLLADSTRAAS